MKSQQYDYSKLKGLIIQKYGTLAAFARDMGLSSALLSARLHNNTYWTQPDIAKACKLLEISNPMDYFFIRKV